METTATDLTIGIQPVLLDCDDPPITSHKSYLVHDLSAQTRAHLSTSTITQVHYPISRIPLQLVSLACEVHQCVNSDDVDVDDDDDVIDVIVCLFVELSVNDHKSA